MEEQGKLLKLPCKVGDKVYREWSCGKNGKSVAEFTVTDIDIRNYPDILFSMSKNGFASSERKFSSKDIGVTVFLDKSELEEKIFEQEDEMNEKSFDEWRDELDDIEREEYNAYMSEGNEELPDDEMEK